MPNRGFIDRLVSIFLLAAFAVSACAPKLAPTPTLQPTLKTTSVPTPKPEAVAETLVEALNARDVDATLALFAEDAVVNTSSTTPATYTGAAEIRGWLEEMAGANLQIKAEHVDVEGETVVERESLSMDPWKEIGITSLDGVRKIKVRDGRIQSLEFSLIETSQSNLQAATLKATQPAYSNVAYSQEGDPAQVLDLYLPQTGNAPFPVILMIHGLGDEKEQHNSLAGFFKQAGFAAVMIGYRGKHPQLVQDALCALAWTRANADNYGLDPERITVFGYSVGGGIAATLGTLDDRSAALQTCGNSLPDHGGILGVAVYEGILGTPEWCLSGLCMDIASGQTGMSLSELQPIFESLRTTEPAKWKDAEAVGPQAEAYARTLPLYWLDGSEPPFLVINGSSEEALPQIESEAFVKRLQEAGVDAQLLLLPGAGHYSIYPNSPNFPKIADAVVKFARKLGEK